MTDEPTTDPLIVVHDLCFGYTASEVLHNVSFEIGEGDLVGIVGPNGGGKTTLLYLLLGLIKPKFGTVNIAGRPPREVRDRIGYVPQHLHFDPRFPVTALDVVNMGHLRGGRFGRFKRKEKDAARSALDQVGLADRQ
ncbi:MAG: ATP-binding cassette domain-containing protein, partial [Kiritimatiellae bacterium]|nr:ATP-binding cassette domain-containing protein [Kiritimatiellia bacterium]